MFQKSIFLTTLIFVYTVLYAQQPIGAWKILGKYKNATSLSVSQGNVYAANGVFMYKLNADDRSIEYYDKINGMNDVGSSMVKYAPPSGTLIVAYNNGNIDLFRNGKFTNMSQLKNNVNITTSKKINHIEVFENTAFLSCEFGVQTLNLQNNTFKETFLFNRNNTPIKVNATAYNNGYLLAATDKGLYIGNYAGSNLMDFNNWLLVNSSSNTANTIVRAVTKHQNGFLASIDDKIYFIETNNTARIFSEHAGWKGFAIASNGSRIFATLGTGTQATQVSEIIENRPLQTINDALIQAPRGIELHDKLFIADNTNDILIYDFVSVTAYKPSGPPTDIAWRLKAKNGQLWVVQGVFIGGFIPIDDKLNFYNYINGEWKEYTNTVAPATEQCSHYTSVEILPERNRVFIGSGSGSGGLVEYDTKNNLFTVHTTNSSLQDISGSGSYRVYGLAYESSKNKLWMTNYYVSNSISAYDLNNGSWKSFNVPNTANLNMVIDQSGNKWIDLPNTDGVLVFNENNFANDNDNKSRIIQSGESNGNLRDNEANCITVDKENVVWIGGKNGITLFDCGSQVFSSNCKGRTPVVNHNGFNSLLFDNETVNAIEVDEANRKWIGTNSGLWLLSSDGEKEIYKFTSENSPLISNEISDLKIDNTTGILYIATSKGIVTFQSDAVIAKNELSCKDIIVYPNPVKPDYSGIIAIRGLVENTHVKITDISGAKVFETTSLGGQAVWDGNDYNGRRAASGVYTAYCAKPDGTDACVVKIFFVH